MRKTAITSEPGLYEVIFMSRKPEAKAFKRWVTHDVLPSIRKRGGYLTPEATEKALTDPDFIIRLATSLKEERARRQAAEAQIEADAPHTRFGRTISSTDGDLLVKQVADLITQGGYPISQVTLFKWLRNHGWLCANQGRLWNAPTKWALEQGYVRSTVLVRVRPPGRGRDRGGRRAGPGGGGLLRRGGTRALRGPPRREGTPVQGPPGGPCERQALQQAHGVAARL